MIGVPLFSAAGAALAERGPAWREHPAYYREEPPDIDGPCSCDVAERECLAHGDVQLLRDGVA